MEVVEGGEEGREGVGEVEGLDGVLAEVEGVEGEGEGDRGGGVLGFASYEVGFEGEGLQVWEGEEGGEGGEGGYGVEGEGEGVDCGRKGAARPGGQLVVLQDECFQRWEC